VTFMYWYVGLSLAFLLAERIAPWRRRQMPWRPAWWTDLFYLVFNGRYLSILLGYLTVHTVAWFSAGTDAMGLATPDRWGWVGHWPWWVQLPALVIIKDFMEWWVHRLLHRVEWLWRVHKVHHSIVDMDWAGGMRFHFGEIVVYQTLLYVPMALLGFAPALFLPAGVFSVAMGYFNHANLPVSLGPLKYVFNSPKMHIWHHLGEGGRPYGQNFAINFSLWDWLFGTVYWPGEQPSMLGFEDIETYPQTPWGQLIAPAWVRQPAAAPGKPHD